MIFLKSIMDNLFFQFVVAICSVFSMVISILALIPTTRNRIFLNNKIKQRIEGNNNYQSAENISNDKKIVRKNDLSQSSKQKVSQTIKGNGNRQAGGDINE